MQHGNVSIFKFIVSLRYLQTSLQSESCIQARKLYTHVCTRVQVHSHLHTRTDRLTDGQTKKTYRLTDGQKDRNTNRHVCLSVMSVCLSFCLSHTQKITNCVRKRSAARAELELEGVVRICVVLERCHDHMNYTSTLHYLKCLYCTGSLHRGTSFKLQEKTLKEVHFLTLPKYHIQ